MEKEKIMPSVYIGSISVASMGTEKTEHIIKSEAKSEAETMA